VSIREEASEAAAGQPAGPGKQLLDAVAVERALTRISHEIVERNEGAGPLVLVGLQTGGVPFAEAIARRLGEIDPGRVGPIGTLDAAMHRDDIGLRPVRPEAETHMPGEIDGATVVLVDDVVFTGRTVRAALDALGHYGRPAAVQLAVMVDRGHRELPIRADYVGKNLPTSRDERVEATLDGVWLQKAGA
jgi:pyrimidine operon attenuation protein / uracil phosphoribosyltransferase